MNFLAAPEDIQPVQGLDRRLGLAFGGAEGGEVVMAHQGLGGPMHRLGIQRDGDMPDSAIVQRGRAAAIEDAVEIMPRRGGKSRMEFAVHNPCVQHHHRRGPQEMIERVAHLVGRKILLQVEMRHLAQGMHAGIGAARARDRRRARRRVSRWRLPARPAPKGHCPGAASRQRGRRHIPGSGDSASGKACAFGQSKALEQFVRRHRLAASALNFQQTQRAFAAGNGEIVTDRFAGCALAGHRLGNRIFSRSPFTSRQGAGRKARGRGSGNRFRRRFSTSRCALLPWRFSWRR